MSAKLKAVAYDAGRRAVLLLDQRRLPAQQTTLECTTVESVYEAIRDLAVRGAPAIGIAAAFAMAMVAERSDAGDLSELRQALEDADRLLRSARPTALNLFTALDGMKKSAQGAADIEAMKRALLAEARRQEAEDEAICRAIGRHGAALLADGDRMMTYCNAGALATANGYGTALAPAYVAAEGGKRIAVTACETRPVLQGARLTAYELAESGIDVTVICDNMIASYLSAHKVSAIFVGADRVAANGDTANKIGTLGLATIARAMGVPFYVCAPTTTIDPELPSGAGVPIEERSAEEVRSLWYRAPMITDGASIYNPAFDVTPAALITGIITEDGIFEAPYDWSGVRHA